jgi:aminoglycoside phosphotransferase (APT) family kinase protein
VDDLDALIAADLAAYLGEEVRALAPIPEGHSGFSYWVDLDGRRGVLRLPPPGARIAGPADIPRQGRLMDALHRAGLPVPAVLAMSDQPVVDGRPFYLVEVVEGERIEKVSGAVPDRDLAHSAVQVLRRMQAVPLADTGIGDEAPSTLEAEIKRWSWLMDRAPAELTGAAPRLAELLVARAPAERRPVLVHADFHYGNMLFRGPEVVAVLDWEIAEVGQPLLDLACLSVVARSVPGGPGSVPGGGAVVVSDRDLLEMYGGADPDEFNWYLALTFYKYAGILGYNLMLHRRGKRPDPTYEGRTRTIVDFLDAGFELLSGSRARRRADR